VGEGAAVIRAIIIVALVASALFAAPRLERTLTSIDVYIDVDDRETYCKGCKSGEQCDRVVVHDTKRKRTWHWPCVGNIREAPEQ
jgi:hypothetical protein